MINIIKIIKVGGVRLEGWMEGARMKDYKGVLWIACSNKNTSHSHSFFQI